MNPISASVEANFNSTAYMSLCHEEKELKDLHWIRDLICKFKEDFARFADLRTELDIWLQHLTNSEIDFTKGSQNKSLNALSFAVLLDYEIIGKFSDALMKKEHSEEALRLRQIIFAGYKGFFGFDHQKTLEAQFKLALYLFAMKEYAQALDLNRKVYQILQGSNVGPSHELSIAVQYNVASIFMHQNKSTEARQLLQDIYRRRIHFLGREHPQSVWAKTQLESCLSLLKKEDVAQKLFDQSHSIALTSFYDTNVFPVFKRNADKIESILGPDHLITLRAKCCVAGSYNVLKQSKKEYEMNRFIFEKRKKILGPAHMETLVAHINVKSGLFKLEDYTHALYECKILCPFLEATYGVDHEYTLMILGSAAECFRSLKKHEEALDMYRILLQRQQRALGCIHEDTIETGIAIASLLGKLGKCAESLDAFQKVYEWRVELYGEIHELAVHSKRVISTGRRHLALLEEGETLACSICLVPLEFIQADAMFLFECTHMFHENCILPWVRDGGTCPDCRSPQHGYEADFIREKIRNLK